MQEWEVEEGRKGTGGKKKRTGTTEERGPVGMEAKDDTGEEYNT